MNESGSHENTPRAGGVDHRRRRGPKAPVWIDALVLTCLVHLLFAVHLRFTGWSNVSEDWLRSWPREYPWWMVVFIPSYLIIYTPSVVRKHAYGPTLVYSTLVAYFLLVFLTPRYTS